MAVAGVTSGLLPHRLAADEEEERRVLHVAITRARERVVVLGDESRPSPFLAELTGEAPHRAAPSPIVRPGARSASASGVASSSKREGGRAPKGDPLEGEEAAREERLKAWRRERSQADAVPAYVVASDATLRAIAQQAPPPPVDSPPAPASAPPSSTSTAIPSSPSSPSPTWDRRPRERTATEDV